MMKCFTITMALTILCTAVAIPEEVAERAFFRSVAGDWTGEGTLTNAEGEDTEVAESWTAAPMDSGGFEFSGTRQWGDDSQEFRWTFSFNVATESVESEYWHTGMDEPLRFEVFLTDDRSEMVSYGNDAGSEVRIVNTLVDGGIVGEVSVKNGDGIEVLGGEVTHTRKGE